MKRFHWIYFGLAILSAAMIACGGASNPGGSNMASSLSVPVTNPAPPAATPSSVTFTMTGNMTAARVGHTATLLNDGRVLIVGGEASATIGLVPSGISAELYDPNMGTFAATGSMNQAHSFQTATLLTNGKVLIAGGGDAELYDPAAGSFAPTGQMLAQNKSVQAALLANGEVLVAGDVDAELYNPATGAFHQAGQYAATGRLYSSATLLADGRVLLEGDDPAQIYDPVSGAFSATASPASVGLPGLDLFSATLLKNGQVLIAGGMNDFRLAAAELYDPASGTFHTTASMQSMRDAHAAVRLADGRVLVMGGDSMSCGGNVCTFSGSLASAELYNPVTASFAAAGEMNVRRTLPQATLLKNGDVLVTGGETYCGISCFQGSQASAELYHPH